MYNTDNTMKVDVNERIEAAKQPFKNGYSCSQAVMMAYADVCNMEPEYAAQLSFPFGGGIARMHEVCGCVCSMALVAGFVEPAPDPKNLTAVQKSRALTRSLAEKFREKHGDIVCRNLLQNKEQHSCIDYVAFAAEAIGLAINEKE